MSLRGKIVLSRCTDPVLNLAAEEMLMKDAGENEITLFLWQNDDTIVIGRNQNVWQECDAEGFLKDGGTIVRRKSGGGAVYHDSGNLNFTFLTRRDLYDLNRNLTVIQNAAAEFGICTRFTGRNDLTADGRKFSGNAFLDDGTVRLHHGTVLIRCDFSRMGKYLTPSRKKLAAKGVASVESRVVNLAEFSSLITPDSFREAMMRSFAETFQLSKTEIIREIQAYPDHGRLQEYAALYASKEWTFGRNDHFSRSLEIQTEKGLFDVSLDVKEGIIASAFVTTDAMDPQIAERMQKELTGRKYRKDEIERVLSQ